MANPEKSATDWLASNSSDCKVCADDKIRAAIDAWLSGREDHGVSLLKFHNDYLRGQLGWKYSYSVTRRHVLTCLGLEGLR